MDFKNPKKDFKVSPYTKVCPEHFRREDFVCFDTKSRRLKAGDCPSLFPSSKINPERSLPEMKKHIEELNDAASEGEGKFDLTDKEDFVSRATQVDVEMLCNHRFSVRVLLDLADTQA